MIETIIKASRIVNADIVLVLLAGICSIRMFSGVMTFVSFVGLAISLVIGIIVYGRVVARIKGEMCPSNIQILKDNWLNYLLVGVLLVLPVFLIAKLLVMVSISPESFILAKESVNALIHMVTIYVLPIVFIKHQNVIAILAGITYLFQNLKGSIELLALVAIMFSLNAAVQYGSMHALSPESSMLQLIPGILLVNTIFTYMAFIIFAAATAVLLKTKQEIVENGA